MIEFLEIVQKQFPTLSWSLRLNPAAPKADRQMPKARVWAEVPPLRIRIEFHRTADFYTLYVMASETRPIVTLANRQLSSLIASVPSEADAICREILAGRVSSLSALDIERLRYVQALFSRVTKIH